MKSIRTRIAAILLVAAMGVTLSACNNDEADSSSTSSAGNAEVSNNGDNSGTTNSANNNNGENNSPVFTTDPNDPTSFLKQEITFGMDPSSSLNGNTTQDPTEAPVQQGGNSAQTVIYTKQVVVTQAGGAAVTDAKGQDVTEVVTEVQTQESSYVAAPISKPVYWLDMTGNSDKTFQGDIMNLEFKIKEGTPDGNYPIILSSPDFVNWDEEQLDVKTVAGYVTVGNAVPTQQDQIQPGQLTISSTCVSGKVGDTITVSLQIHDNPGLVGMLFKVEYDSGALEFVDSEAFI